MKISKLDLSHSNEIKELYLHGKFMGESVSSSWTSVDDDYNNLAFEIFKKTYLSGLNNFHAFGMFNDTNTLECLISLYDSSDEPSWYYTLCRSKGNIKLIKKLFDHVLEVQESKNRYKFYTLVNKRHSKLLRKFTYSNYNNNRYGYYDEFIVHANTKCYYNNAWELLFKRTMLPVDTIVRCSYLKQEYRGNIPLGGSL
jgi:hypothetical protein